MHTFVVSLVSTLAASAWVAFDGIMVDIMVTEESMTAALGVVVSILAKSVMIAALLSLLV